MRIFLSYGHDANEELVRLIKADLERRGHDVWFDQSEIRFGDDWRREITDGIIGSKRVLSFLSKYSTRDPGVCLDELAIAIGAKGGNIQTVLVESETEVKLPPSIGHIQWLDMHDWKERRAAGEAAWEDWYRSKLAEIVRVIESDESQRFAGEIRTLEEHLKPISSDTRIAQLLRKPLVGRTWLFDAVDQWRNASDRASRLFWIMGAPGVGKSAFAAHLTHFGRDKVIAAQFVEYDKPDGRDSHRIVRTLAFQIATRLPDYRKLLLTLPEITELDRKNPADLFDYLLANPLKLSISGGRERYLIVIDALDEAGGSGRNELVEMLAHNAPRLPDWIGIVATSRPESDVVAPLQGLNPITLDTSTETNRADIREYLHRQLAPQLAGRTNAEHLVVQILDKSEGVFLYAERFCQDVQYGHLSLDRPEHFPQGLGGVFHQYFQRQFPDLETFRRDVRPALRTILAAREPLPVEILQRLFNWQDEELRDFTRPLTSLFPVTSEAGHEVIKPYHKSLADWLADEPKAGAYFISSLEGHRALATFGWKQCEENPLVLDRYFLKWISSHLGEAKDENKLTLLQNNCRYLIVRNRRGMNETLPQCSPTKDGWIIGTNPSAKCVTCYNIDHLEDDLVLSFPSFLEPTSVAGCRSSGGAFIGFSNGRVTKLNPDNTLDPRNDLQVFDHKVISVIALDDENLLATSQKGRSCLVRLSPSCEVEFLHIPPLGDMHETLIVRSLGRGHDFVCCEYLHSDDERWSVIVYRHGKSREQLFETREIVMDIAINGDGRAIYAAFAGKVHCYKYLEGRWILEANRAQAGITHIVICQCDLLGVVVQLKDRSWLELWSTKGLQMETLFTTELPYQCIAICCCGDSIAIAAVDGRHCKISTSRLRKHSI